MDNKDNTGKDNSGDYNSGNRNSGNRNSGYRNSGDYNSGDYNSGHYNSGDCNSGYRNSGYRNSGDYNSGHYNRGHYNRGHYNRGHYNSGHYNSGDYNSGHYNSGDCNSGDCNSGDYNSGRYNSGYFNTNEPNVRLFNKDTGLKRSDISIPYIDLKINEWVIESNMTDEQKKNDPDFHVKKGTLITRTYKEAWALYWSEASKSDRQLFLDLPNFDANIFEEITGIKVNAEPTCSGKIVEIDGKKYKLEEI